MVVNNDFARPLRLAQEAATVDLLTDGRLELGLGSGWAKPEYELLEIPYDPPRIRAARLAEAITVMKRAWAGEVTITGARNDRAAVPKPTQLPHPPLLIGGNSDAVLQLAAKEAEIIGFTGATWTGSRLEATGASHDAFAERVGFVRSVAGRRFSDLELNVLVQSALVGDHAADRAHEISKSFGIPLEVLRLSPITLVGTVGQVTEKLLAIREDLGLTYFVVFDTAIDDMAPVVAGLAGS
jgi:probable F420-dependent oxidoreductase